MYRVRVSCFTQVDWRWRSLNDQSVEKFKHTHKGSIESIVEQNISDQGIKSGRVAPVVGLNPGLGVQRTVSPMQSWSPFLSLRDQGHN
jgi:hypothetical protein